MNTASESVQNKVFQPPQLKEIVEVIDLMGTVASRVREDNRTDLPVTGSQAGKAGTQTGGTPLRDQAIAHIPPVAIMQKKLVQQLEGEIKRVERQARALARSNTRGSAFALSELYKKIRRLTSIIADILSASAEMIKRFYVSVFIDRQPLVVTGGTLKETQE